jgi:Insertion element 4 transposase N-terminal
VVYFVLALWLFRGRNCGYARVMSKLVDALYHRRRGQQLLAVDDHEIPQVGGVRDQVIPHPAIT